MKSCLHIVSLPPPCRDICTRYVLVSPLLRNDRLGWVCHYKASDVKIAALFGGAAKGYFRRISRNNKSKLNEHREIERFKDWHMKVASREGKLYYAESNKGSAISICVLANAIAFGTTRTANEPDSPRSRDALARGVSVVKLSYRCR